MTKSERLTYDDVAELLELIQLCWMRAPDRFNHPEQTAASLQESLLKLVELRQKVLQQVIEKDSPLNCVLFIQVVLKMLSRKPGLTGSAFLENLKSLETLTALMVDRHKEALKK